MGKNSKVPAIVVFAVFVSSTFFANRAFASGTSGCGIFEIRPDCDLSGWLHFVFGLAIGIFLALLFHYLSHRNLVRIDRIIASQTALRNGKGMKMFGNIMTAAMTWKLRGLNPLEEVRKYL